MKTDKNSVKIDLLKNSLKQFGLNPKEWQLQQQDQDRWLIQNSDQRELKMIGTSHSKDKFWDWKAIELLYII